MQLKGHAHSTYTLLMSDEVWVSYPVKVSFNYVGVRYRI
jgi:hypothetical protein